MFSTTPDGTVLDLFGSGGGATTAARLSEGQEEAVPLLGSVPLSVDLRMAGDAGVPVVLSAPDDPAARALSGIAARLAVRRESLAGRSLPLSLR